MLVCLFITFDLPILDYCDQLYDSCTMADVERLESFLLKGARACSGAMVSTNSDRLLKEELGWETLTNRRKRHKLFMFYKIIKGITPAYLHECLPVNPTPSYSRRRPHDLYPFKCNTNRFQCSFFPSAIELWNHTSNNLLQIESLCSFKENINNEWLPKPPPSFFGWGPRRQAILHTCLRLHHNCLNKHLHRIGVKNSPACSCGYREESEMHYILFCPKYVDARQQLFQKVSNLVPQAFKIHELLLTRPKVLLNLLLNGSNLLTVAENRGVFKEMYAYIESTERFVR